METRGAGTSDMRSCNSVSGPAPGINRSSAPKSCESRMSGQAQNKTPQTHLSRGTLGRTALPRKLLNHNLTRGGAGVNGPIGQWYSTGGVCSLLLLPFQCRSPCPLKRPNLSTSGYGMVRLGFAGLVRPFAAALAHRAFLMREANPPAG